MKLFKLLLFFTLFTAIISSCGKSNEELLVGTWNEVQTGQSVLHYFENGTYKFEYDNDDVEVGKWRVEGTTLYTTTEGSDEELSEELTVLDSKKMVVTIGGMFQTTYERAEK